MNGSASFPFPSPVLSVTPQPGPHSARSIWQAVGILIAKQNRPERLVERVDLTRKAETCRTGAVHRYQIITIVGQKPVPGQIVEVLDALRLQARVYTAQLSAVLLVSLTKARSTFGEPLPSALYSTGATILTTRRVLQQRDRDARNRCK